MLRRSLWVCSWGRCWGRASLRASTQRLWCICWSASCFIWPDICWCTCCEAGYERDFMSQVREPGFDRIVAMVLRIGAFSCFFVMLAGLIDGLFMTGRIPVDIERMGVLLMLATPVVRVIVACYLFFHEKDYKYGWISFGVLVILMLGSVFGIGEH